ncbi:MAG: hypothetical protein AB7F43_12575 [Bacteriovoracia bacterium]
MFTRILLIVLVLINVASASDARLRSLMRAWVAGDETQFEPYMVALLRAGNAFEKEIEAARNFWVQREVDLFLNTTPEVSKPDGQKLAKTFTKSLLRQGARFGITEQHVLAAFKDGKPNSNAAAAAKGALLIKAAGEDLLIYLDEEQYREYPVYTDTSNIAKWILIGGPLLGLYGYLSGQVDLVMGIVMGAAPIIPAACFYFLTKQKGNEIEQDVYIRRGNGYTPNRQNF